jgi:hypothetical protein
MHDPLTVAFDIRRPWPRPSSGGNRSKQWSLRSPFWRIAGRTYYWPSIITVWHVEPGGQDSGEVCRHYRRVETPTGHKTVWMRGWRWHVHHWRIQVHPLQNLRRALLTRCAWCHGRSTKSDRVNISHQWDGPRGNWWRGEPGLFHSDCSMVEHAHRMCLCETPDVNDREYGQCARCSRFAAWRTDPARKAQAAILTAVPTGRRATPEQLTTHCSMAKDLT